MCLQWLHASLSTVGLSRLFQDRSAFCKLSISGSKSSPRPLSFQFWVDPKLEEETSIELHDQKDICASQTVIPGRYHVNEYFKLSGRTSGKDRLSGNAITVFFIKRIYLSAQGPPRIFFASTSCGQYLFIQLFAICNKVVVNLIHFHWHVVTLGSRDM